MSEKSSEESREQNSAIEIISSLFALTKVLGLYDANNDAVKRQLDQILAALERYFAGSGQPLRIQLLQDEFFVNGQLLHVDAVSYERARTLADFLIHYDLGDLTFQPGATLEHLIKFAGDMGETLRAGKNLFNPQGYGIITLAKSQGQSVAAFRFQPERLAIFVYGGLLDLVDRLYEEFKVNKTPSLLPVKRTVQLIIDAMKHHSAIYQVLAAVRDPKTPTDVSRRRVATAVEAIGFGYYLGLSAVNLMTLALGAILGGLSEEDDPDSAIEPLFRFPGLGDSAMSLALAIHDTRAVRRKQSGGVPGRMLAVCEIYVELTTATDIRPALSPSHALELMSEGKAGSEVGPARLFLDHKGRYPIGAPVKLSNGELMVVVTHGEGEAGKQRPVVAALLPDGSLGKRIVLLERSDLQIVETPPPADLNFSLCRT